MSLAPGASLGPYEILSAIGAGGMGEVYHGRDTRLNRDVAIKILPNLFAADADRVARFQREAQLLAALNHPNIAQIHGLEDTGKSRALVLEFVQGPTLAERIEQGAIPIDEALTIAGQIADALDAAHEHGIIHRDLKPANIKLKDDGTVKVLDFGLAKAVATESSSINSISPTITSPALATHAGIIIGTAAYMSPEQARGKVADKRADIWAFGCVLFEMLTGRRAFDGEEVSDILAAILRAEPDWSQIPGPTPTGVTRLLHRCLEKDRKKRIADIADVRFELNESRTTAPAPVPAATYRWATPIAAIVGIAVGVVLTTVLSQNSGGRDSPATLTRSFINVNPAEQLRSAPGDQSISGGHPSRPTFALSPDGRSLIFSGTNGGSQQLYLRALDRLEAVPIAGTENGASPFFSPDGNWIGFSSAGWLRKVPMTGGPSTAICEAPFFIGASWSDNDSIVFGAGVGGLMQVPASGGTPKTITKLDTSKGEVSHRLPHVLPGGRAVLFTVTKTLLPTWDDTTIAVQNLDTGERKIVLDGGADARYLSSGHVLYMRRGTLMAAPFSIQSLSVSGGSLAMLSGVMQSANMPNNGLDSGVGQFATSSSGTLAYLPGSIYEFPNRAVVWIDREGRAEELKFTPRAYLYPRLSPDGKQIAISTQGDRTIWVHDMSRNAEARLTPDGRSVAPVWTPDGQGIVFGSSTVGRENLFLKRFDSTTPQQIAASEGNQRPAAWSKSSDTLVYTQSAGPSTLETAASGNDLWVFEKGKTRPVLSTRFNEVYPDFSPDGRWLAYTSNESGRNQVYVVSYPQPGAPILISTNGGVAPSWNANGHELFYVEPGQQGPGSLSVASAVNRMMSVPVTTSPKFSAAKPVRLFEARFVVANIVRGYDVAADGLRFLTIRNEDRPPIKPDRIVLVQNWAQELARMLPEK